jgi:hypothetical protein
MEMLQSASTSLHDKEDCKKYFTGYPALHKVIDKYMICTIEAGNLDAGGKELLKMKPSLDGCLPTQIKMKDHEFAVTIAFLIL